jgi:hypothetical protein
MKTAKSRNPGGQCRADPTTKRRAGLSLSGLCRRAAAIESRGGLPGPRSQRRAGLSLIGLCCRVAEVMNTRADPFPNFRAGLSLIGLCRRVAVANHKQGGLSPMRPGDLCRQAAAAKNRCCSGCRADPMPRDLSACDPALNVLRRRANAKPTPCRCCRNRQKAAHQNAGKLNRVPVPHHLRLPTRRLRPHRRGHHHDQVRRRRRV